jgi:putative FmdB family regulatory protein
MPIYEYRCENGHTFEVMQSFQDDPVSECETCSLPVVKVFHPVAVHFKGKGFYNTDYGTRKRAREKEASEAAGSSDGKKSESSGSSDSSGSSSEGKKSSESSGSSESKSATGGASSDSGSASGTPSKSTGSSKTPPAAAA